jgi:predicted dehydrogenase
MQPKAAVLKVALVGCGAVAQRYYTPALAELERRTLLEVRALFDPNPASVAPLQKAFPAAVRVHSLHELPQRGVDLAIVASPVRFHAEQTMMLLHAGLAVLCEKPMAATVAEAEAVIEAARAARRILAVGLMRRFFPAIQTIRDWLSLGILGDIENFYCFEGGNFRWPVQSASFFHKTGVQGGVLLDLGVHLLDLLSWWWGQPVEVFYEDDAMGGMEANCRLKLTFAQGFSGEVRLSRDWSLPNRYVIQGTKGWLSWQVNVAERLELGFHNTNFALNSQLHYTGQENALPTLGQPGFTFEQSFVSQLCNVVAAVQGSAPLVVPGEQALQSLKLIEYCYQHRTLMSMPWLSAQESLCAQQLSAAHG